MGLHRRFTLDQVLVASSGRLIRNLYLTGIIGVLISSATSVFWHRPPRHVVLAMAFWASLALGLDFPALLIRTIEPFRRVRSDLLTHWWGSPNYGKLQLITQSSYVVRT